MLKQAKTAAEIELKRARQEELRAHLDEQVRLKAEQKQQQKLQVLTYVQQQQENQKEWEQIDAARKEEKCQLAASRQSDIKQQMESDTIRRQRDKAARTAALKPMHKTKKDVAPSVELEEQPVLRTLGATIRYIPVLKNSA